MIRLGEFSLLICIELAGIVTIVPKQVANQQKSHFAQYDFPMNSADEILKRQAMISHCSGDARISLWLLVVGAVVLVGSALSAFHEGTSILSAITGPLFVIALALRLRATARAKSRELEQTLS